MPRVTGQKTRQMIFPADENAEMATGVVLDRLELFLPDGTPFRFAAEDRNRMRWAGVWHPNSTYEENDVVEDEGDLFIAVSEEVFAASVAPHIEHATIGDTAPAPGSVNGTAGERAIAYTGSNEWYQVLNGTRDLPASVRLENTYGVVLFYFDLKIGGTVTITDEAITEHLILYDPSGNSLGGNIPSPGVGNSLVKAGLVPGRYYVFDQAGVVADEDNPAHIRITPSAGAVLGEPDRNWEVVLRAGEDGPDLGDIEVDLVALYDAAKA